MTENCEYCRWAESWVIPKLGHDEYQCRYYPPAVGVPVVKGSYWCRCFTMKRKYEQRKDDWDLG